MYSKFTLSRYQMGVSQFEFGDIGEQVSFLTSLNIDETIIAY